MTSSFLPFSFLPYPFPTPYIPSFPSPSPLLPVPSFSYSSPLLFFFFLRILFLLVLFIHTAVLPGSTLHTCLTFLHVPSFHLSFCVFLLYTTPSFLLLFWWSSIHLSFTDHYHLFFKISSHHSAWYNNNFNMYLVLLHSRYQIITHSGLNFVYKIGRSVSILNKTHVDIKMVVMNIQFKSLVRKF